MAGDMNVRIQKWWTKLSLIISGCILFKPKQDAADAAAGPAIVAAEREDVLIPSQSESGGDANADAVVAVAVADADAEADASSAVVMHLEAQNFPNNLRSFSFDELKEFTNDFRPSNILGQGGFGCVFKGIIRRSRSPTGRTMAVAVKVLDLAGVQGHREWLTEIYYLGQLVHPNVVRLIGYCIEEEKRVLVYEYMPRGSLDNHLHRRSSAPFPWRMRVRVALDSARGLAFLHEQSDKPVILRDFKSSNILLDAEYNAKLSDFGLAKDGPKGDQTHVSTRVMGTVGYAAPEYIATGHLSLKSDVYCYGVFLLELISGRRANDKSKPRGEVNLPQWARPYLADMRKYLRLMDPRLEGQYPRREAHAFIHVAKCCVTAIPSARPTMSEVVNMLEPLLLREPLTINVHSTGNMIAGIEIHHGATRAGIEIHGPTRAGPSSSSSAASSSRSLPNSPFRPHYPLPCPSPMP